MKVLFDLHTHTIFSDGKSILQENIARATDAGIILGASDHGKGQVFFGIKDSNFNKLKQEINEHNTKAENKVFLGIEGNLLNKAGRTDLLFYDDLDYYILGYHRGISPFSSVSLSLWLLSVFNKQKPVQIITDALIKAIETDKRIQIISHPGLYIPINMDKLSRAAAKNGVALEINGKHPPSVEQIKIAKKNGAKFIISSDAHHFSWIGNYEKLIEIAILAGLSEKDIVNVDGYDWSDNLRIDSIAKKCSQNFDEKRR